MNNFQVTDTKFYNELRNGAAFNVNLLDFTDSLLGNVEETIQVIKTISVETTVLASDFGSIEYQDLTTAGIFTLNGNWFNEGISVGATIDIIWENDTKLATETVISMTGFNNSILRTTRANLSTEGLANSSRSDFKVKVSSAPNRISFKYGLNQLTATSNNYISPLGGNEQAYYTNNVTGSFTSLIKIGNPESWNLGNVEVKFDGTTNIYTHSFTVKHTFKIPYYQDGQIGNIAELVTPTNLSGSNSFKYGFGLFMSETNNSYNRIFEDVGAVGGVGYFNENFNGQQNDYSVRNVAYSNVFDSTTISATEETIVTLQVRNTNGNFVAGDKVILKHSKLPTESEYANKTDSFNDIWLFDSLATTEGAVSIDSVIITLFTVVLNADPTLLDITFTIAYNTKQLEEIANTKDWLLSIIVGDETLTPYLSNRVNLKIDSDNWAVNPDVTGLIQNNDIRFFDGDKTIIIPTSSEVTDFKGWDANFIGLNCTFQTKAEDNAILTRASFKLIADNGTDFFELNVIRIPLGTNNFTDSNLTTFTYQITDNDTQGQYNIQDSETFNRVSIFSVVPFAGTIWQDWNIQLAFKVSWRDWIENVGVPNLFYDNTKLNNNKNFKTSNYSDINGYKIYGVIDLEIKQGEEGRATTTYRLTSHESPQLDFDVSGVDVFTGDVKLYDINNNLVDNVYNNENVRIEIEFDHSTGVLTKAQGEIIIEPVNTTGQEWRLSTFKDWSNDLNPLQPIISEVVEIVIINNKVTLKCNTNNLNLVAGIEYNIYGKLY